MFDLGVEGGTIVSSRGRRRGNLYVTGGRVAKLGDSVERARQRVDATGLLVLPGMVDAHVHFMDSASPEREDFPTGSAAAVAAGVTTVIEHTHAQPVLNGTDLRRKVEHLRDRSHADFGLAAHVWPDRVFEARSAWAAGAAYLKAFTCTTHGVPGLDAAHLRELFATAAEISATCLVHCEDETLTAHAERALREDARMDGGVIPEWRNRDAELVSVTVAMLLAARTGARVVAAHVSNDEALAVVDSHRGFGASVLAESCPQYLHLREDEVLTHGAFRKFTPPARARSEADLAAMWTAFNTRRIDYISTDHAPATAAQKSEGSIWDAHFGLPGIDTTLPLLLDAAARGVTSYERVVEAYAEAPARIYGFYPRKGHLGVGADADLALVDPEAAWEIRNGDVISKAGWSPFAGRTVRGRIRRTYLRGELAAEDRVPACDPGRGRFQGGRGLAATS